MDGMDGANGVRRLSEPGKFFRDQPVACLGNQGFLTHCFAILLMLLAGASASLPPGDHGRGLSGTDFYSASDPKKAAAPRGGGSRRNRLMGCVNGRPVDSPLSAQPSDTVLRH
jgi:hypothetical protein